MGDDAAGPGAETTKAPRSTASLGASIRASAEQQQPKPLPAAGLASSIATDGSAAVQSCGGGGGEDNDEDDEQVERFYALLANIRALRGLYSAGGGTGRGRKRPREAEAEAPWRPAFRMEDFRFEEEEVVGRGTDADARCAVVKQGAGGGSSGPDGGAKRPAAAAAKDHEEDEVAAEEARPRALGRRVAARG